MPGSRALRVGQQVALGRPWPWRVQSQSSSCHGAGGISDLKVIQRSNPLPERIDAGQPRASSGSAGGFGTDMAMACAIAIIFLPAVTRQPFSTPALGFTSEPRRRFLRARGEGGKAVSLPNQVTEGPVG